MKPNDSWVDRITVKQINRMWAKTDVRGKDECWEYQGYRKHFGHGSISVFKRSTVTTSRIVFYLSYGYLPPAVCHKCDNPPCNNPWHLFGGTIGDNHRDMDSKGRRRAPKHERDTFPLTKVTSAEVLQIMDRRAAGERVKDLAAEYGINEGHMSRLSRGMCSYVPR